MAVHQVVCPTCKTHLGYWHDDSDDPVRLRHEGHCGGFCFGASLVVAARELVRFPHWCDRWLLFDRAALRVARRAHGRGRSPRPRDDTRAFVRLMTP